MQEGKKYQFDSAEKCDGGRVQRESTAFEGLLGYLYLSRQQERLDFLMNRSLMYLAREFEDV